MVFAIAMGFLESAVVIYLRELYYKEGFSFPLKPMPETIALVELLREAATVIMLVSAGYLAGRTKLQRFAYFCLAFAVWDLFYYVFLYIFLGWPQSLFTWDILFLIPLPWTGPVWAPCVLSLLMIAGALHVIVKIHQNDLFAVKRLDWLLLICGALIVIISFMWDCIAILAAPGFHAVGSKDLLSLMHSYVPQLFNHALFFTGFALMCYPVLTTILITKNKTNEKE